MIHIDISHPPSSQLHSPQGKTGNDTRVLGLPDPLDAFCQPHVIGLEFIEAHTNHNCRKIQKPHENPPCSRVIPIRDVIDDYRSVKRVSVPVSRSQRVSRTESQCGSELVWRQ